jgi:type I restriction enzyme R subunit
VKGASGKPEAFHTYSMRQAIEEGFILDVLRNYTTYSTWFKFVKTVEDDPAIPKKKGAKALAKFKELHPHNIEQKTEVMVEHFREHVRHQLGGRGKAMVVTASRIQAVRYKLAFERYIQEQGYADIRSLVAFSGTVKDPDTGVEYTEPGMNPDASPANPSRKASCPSASAPAITRCCWWPTNTRPALTSRCCARCTWTSGWTACRRCRRCRA